MARMSKITRIIYLTDEIIGSSCLLYTSVCVNENCKRDAKDLKNENDWHPITEKEARQVELPFQ